MGAASLFMNIYDGAIPPEAQTVARQAGLVWHQVRVDLLLVRRCGKAPSHLVCTQPTVPAGSPQLHTIIQEDLRILATKVEARGQDAGMSLPLRHAGARRSYGLTLACVSG